MSRTTEAEGYDHRVTGWSGLGRRLLDWGGRELTCLTDLASNERLDPDYPIIPEGNQSLVVQAEASADLQRVHANEAFRVYRVGRRG